MLISNDAIECVTGRPVLPRDAASTSREDGRTVPAITLRGGDSTVVVTL
jgi:hypothetical protein